LRNLNRYILFVLITLWPAVMHAQDNSKVQSLLTEADACISKNELTEALGKTREALQISPENIPVLQKQISILFLMKDDKEAMKETEDAISKYPEEPDFYYLRGVIYNSREKYERALDNFDHAIGLKSSPNLYKFYLGRGISHLNMMEYELAMSDFTSTIEMNDTVAGAYHGRAMVNYELHDYSSAVSDFLKTLDYSNGNSALYFNLGMSYYRLDEKSNACPYFHKACTLGNTNACRMALMECAKAIPTLP
jgi:tetratricopeptide (TPR) repeat protein